MRASGPPRAQGRWSLVVRELQSAGAAAPVSNTESTLVLAGVLLERHGVLTRDAVRAESVPGGFAGVYPVLKSMEESGRIRRGYFVTGMGGAQFALPGAVDRLRAAAQRSGEVPATGTVIVAATDPANAYGLSLPWPVKGPTRLPGAHVVLVGGVGSLYVERGGRGLVALRDFDGTWEEAAIAAIVDRVDGGRWHRVMLQRFPDELAAALKDAGFTPTPKGLVRYTERRNT